MLIDEKEKSPNVKQDRQRVHETDYRMPFLREKLCNLEQLLLQKEKYNKEKDTEVTVEGEKGATHTISINPSVRNEEALRRQIHDTEYCAEDYIQRIADFEQNLLKEGDLSKRGYYEDARKKLPVSELYRNMRVLDENRRHSHEVSENSPRAFENSVGIKCQAKNHSCFCDCPRKKGKKESICRRTCNNTPRRNSFAGSSCDEDEPNSAFKSDRSKLNVSPETANKKVPRKKPTCSCPEISSSSDDSDDSFYKCLYMPKDQFDDTCNNDDEDVESKSSIEDRTTCSEMSKSTCYCSKNHSHGESSEADSDCDEYHREKKAKTERFRGGLDVINPKTRMLTKYVNKKPKEANHCSKVTNAGVDNLKFLKVEELREGLERLKIRNRNLRDFLNTLQNPINLMGKPSEANTICTRVSSCCTFDVARQTRSGLLTVVEHLKGKCRNQDAVIVALADELKSGNDKKMDVQDVEKDRILTQDKSLVWNGLMEEKDKGQMFTKKDSVIGFAVFLMILISHVKRSEMISYLSAAKIILTESPFKLGLFISEAERFSIDVISTYYQDFAYSLQSSVKDSFDRWANIVQRGQWFDSYFVRFKHHVDDVNCFFVTNQSFILSSFYTIFIGILLINFKKVWQNLGLRSAMKFGKFYFIISAIFKLTEIMKMLCLNLLSSRILWFVLGFGGRFLWNLLHANFYRYLDSFKMYYLTNAEYSISQNLNKTQELIDNSCKLFDRFDYSWIASIFCNKFQCFVQFMHYIIKNT